MSANPYVALFELELVRGHARAEVAGAADLIRALERAFRPVAEAIARLAENLNAALEDATR